MCSSEPPVWQSGNCGVSTRPHWKRLDGQGRTSQTDWIRNLIWCGLAFQTSLHKICWSAACSHWVHAPCFHIPIVLCQRASFTPAQTFSWISWCLSFTWPFFFFFLPWSWLAPEPCPSRSHCSHHLTVSQPLFSLVNCLERLPLPACIYFYASWGDFDVTGVSV